MNEYSPEGCLLGNLRIKRSLCSVSQIASACNTDEIFEGVASLCDADHNLTVNLGGVTGIIPRTEGALGIEEGYVRDIALLSRVGKNVCFTVKQLKIGDDGKTYAILSRKNAQQMCMQNYIANLSPGDVIPVKVTHLERFGAFCDIGCGIAALLPIDGISVSRISHPSDRLYTSQDIFAVVKSNENGRITLSLKELLGTWEENAANYKAGQTVTGVVRSIEEYGIFVELTPNLAGLADSKPGVNKGDTASVYIKSILPEKMKVKLIIVDSFAGNYTPELKYFNSGSKIKQFNYSPASAEKQIVTVF